MLARALLVSLAALVFAPIVLADGGPDPGVLEADAGITTAGSASRYVTVQAGPLTTLERVAIDGGQIVNSRLLYGGWGVPLVDYTGTTGGLSPNGRTLILAQSGYDGVCTPRSCTPLRRTTRFQIINPNTLRSRTTVKLRGDFSYDALSPNGQRLYLIEHRSTFNLDKYVVRAYDLKQRLLLPGVIADRTQRGWIMQGIPTARATSKDGRYVYTLYANPGGYPFVHALDTVAGRAHCVGIPWTNEQGLGDLDLLQLSANGQTLRIGRTTSTTGVADTQLPAPSAQLYFTLDTRNYRVVSITATHSGFRWWALSLLALALPPVFIVMRKRSRSIGRSSSSAQALPRSA